MLKAAGKMDLQEVVVTGARQVQQEQLGDLKLYRVPDRTTFASRQSKQVRLMDREAVPVHLVYGFELAGWPGSEDEFVPAARMLRTRNTRANHLGLPLPSGSIEVYAEHGGGALLADETGIRDTAVDEEVELKLSESHEVQVKVTAESEAIDSKGAQQRPLHSGVALRSAGKTGTLRATVTNALPHPIEFELELALPDGARILSADHAVTKKDGKPLIRLTVPANGETTVRLLGGVVEDRAVPSR
jgi:hypothetical protein